MEINEHFQPLESLMHQVLMIAHRAGEAVMEVYSQKDFDTTYFNNSPVTRADRIVHHLIEEGLQSLTPGLPVLSEHSESIPFEERKLWTVYWLVDPLDGTKEFIKRNGEFTINVALIEKGIPILGVVHAPAQKVTYYAAVGKGAFKHELGRDAQKIRVGDHRNGPLKVAVSRSHADSVLDLFLQKLGPVECVVTGSSLKFCLVAEGSVHLYPRLGPTMEWDTAAGHCVLAEAGGSVTDLSEVALKYNKPNLLNPSFIACSRSAYPFLEPFLTNFLRGEHQ